MALVEHLLATRTPLELAKELAKTVKENAELQRQVLQLEIDLFWIRTAHMHATAELLAGFKKYVTAPAGGEEYHLLIPEGCTIYLKEPDKESK